MITASIAPRIALNRVKTFARMISPIVRLVRSPVSFTAPRATRSCTSAVLRPVAGVVNAVGCAAGSAVWPDVSGAVTGGRRGSGVGPHEGDLAGGVVFEHPVAAELRE